MDQIALLLLLAALVFVAVLPFELGRIAAVWTARALVFSAIFPFRLWMWCRKRREIQRRRRNYEILGSFVEPLGNDRDVLRHFRSLIEAGIDEKDLRKLLKANLAAGSRLGSEPSREEIGQDEAELKKMAAEQRQILIQSRLSLEQIKFREQLLDQLYQKIRRKYRL